VTVPERPVLAVIPARGGSKRVPRKNVREMAGRPLIAYTIEAALNSGIFARVVVSTDDDEIARIGRSCGAEVPFLRSVSLADDITPVSAATADALGRLDPDGAVFADVAQLMANCPLRTAEDVRASHVAFRARRAPAQISVARYGWQSPWWALARDAAGRIEPVFADRLQQRSQDLPDLFCPTGAIWWATAETLRTHRTYHVAGRTGWELPWDHAIDIDTEDDWRLAEGLLLAARWEAARAL
jgi:N-acylneuraminate cytidylyltransferase